MANLKSLAKDTAIYGLSSIVGRFLNYLLVPLYTAKIAVESGGYGVITNIYAYTALLLVILTYGMETTFFRFANKEGVDPMRVYSTTLISVGATSLMFVACVLAFLDPIADFMGYSAHRHYVAIMFICVAIDAFQCIPFAFLRYQKRPIKFASLKLLFVIMNILLNLLYFAWLPELYKTHPDIVGHIYNPAVSVGYAFAINLLCTASITVWFWPELIGFKWVFDAQLFKKMLSYSWPILVLGIAGILNQTADKLIYPIACPGSQGKVELGIYGAAVKIAMIMAMITQAFRYAYEPFVFGKSKEKDKDSRDTYAKAMKYFLIFTLLAFLCVMLYLDVIKHIIGKDYWEGLKVVPIVMTAEIMMGVYFNLSFWYKLIDKTIWGAYFSGIGCIVLIAINIIFIPEYGYMACAWAGVAGYGTSMVLSYIVGQKKYPINYPLKDIFCYVVLTAAIYAASVYLVPADWHIAARLACNTLLLMVFIAYLVKKDFPLKALPVIGKFFKK